MAAAARYRVGALPSGVRCLVLCGRNDLLVNPRCSQRLARHLGATMVEHPSAGHDLPLDDPAWLLEKITKWAGV
jgi:pimeloyl-ACP methyl ester carboxylesterase